MYADVIKGMIPKNYRPANLLENLWENTS
jgi:hypothetical protein